MRYIIKLNTSSLGSQTTKSMSHNFFGAFVGLPPVGAVLIFGFTILRGWGGSNSWAFGQCGE